MSPALVLGPPCPRLTHALHGACLLRLCVCVHYTTRAQETFETVLQLACDGCKAVAGAMRTALLEHTKRLATARGLVGTG